MALGEFCRFDSDCGNNQFFDTTLACINGICQEAPTGGSAASPASIPTPVPTPVRIDESVCPPRGTFINCITQSNGNVVGLFNDGLQLNDGTCGTFESVTTLCQQPVEPTPIVTPMTTPTPMVVCTPPNGPFAQTVSRSCRTVDAIKYISGNATVTQTRSYVQSNTPGECQYTNWQDTAINTSACVSTYRTAIYATPSNGGVVTGTADITNVPRSLSDGKKELEATIGTSTSFTATENAGYTFVGWYLNNELWSTDRSPSILVNTNNVFEARFRVIEQQPVTCKCYFVAPINAGTSYTVRYIDCATNTLVTRTFDTFTNICAADIPANVSNTQVAQDINSDCTQTKTCAPPPICTPPVDATRQISIECVAVNNTKYQSGLAYRTEIRAYDVNATGPGICPWTESTWTQSGALDTSACILINSSQVCTPPTDASRKEEQIDCTTISPDFSGGTATQAYVRTYDTTQIGGICPWKNWEATGTPNTATCIRKTSWRNCVTGELVEGTPPADFSQGTYQGNVCWEPTSDLAFTPVLNDALRYSYQRGSSNFPQSKVITVTNSSYGVAYRVTLQTNNNIRLTHNNLSSNGTLSFVIASRESKTFSITVTPELLNSLPDGLASLSMNVEYIRVVE